MNAQALQRLEALPSIPGVVQEILKVLNDPDAPLAEVAGAIAKEPGLTGRIVAAANAAVFAGRRPVYNVDDATTRLGLARVKMIATSVLLGVRFNPRRCPRFSSRVYWQQAMRAADCAGKLVQLLPVETAKEAAALGGLLHNIGLLANAYSFPEVMNRLLDTRLADPAVRLSALEKDALGFDHHESGAVLLASWRMPAEVVACVRHLADEDYTGEYARLVRVVRVAARWAQDGFRNLPQDPVVRSLDGVRLRRIGESCLREGGQFDAFAMMLDAAA